MSRRLIWGETMRQRIAAYKNKEFPASGLFLTGFVIGVVLPNLIYKMEWRQDTASALYLMGILTSDGGKEYFIKVLRMRGGLFLLAAGSGLTIFGVPTAVAGMILTGMIISMLLTVSILQFGLHGGLVGAGLLFPQFLIYLPCLVVTCAQIYESSMQIWKRKNFFPGQISAYILKMLLCAAFFVAGIFLEVYCNPLITEILIRNLKIF